MDLRDIFRRFFGLPQNGHYSGPHWSDSYKEEDEDDSDHCYDDFCPHEYNKEPDGFRFGFDFPNDKKGLDGMFEHFHGDMWRQMEALHKQMDEMMKGFGEVDFPPAFQPPSLPPSPPTNPGHREDEKKSNRGGHHFFWFDNTPSPFFGHDERSKQNPRDFMLKESFDDESRVLNEPEARTKPKIGPIFTPHVGEKPSKNQDTDLDGKLSDDEILSLVKRPPSDQIEQRKPAQLFSSGSSMSFTTIRGADGRVEQKKVVRNSGGQEETTVTRSLGDQSHSVTTIVGQDGLQEKHESFQNMDENDKENFEKKWNQSPRSSSPANVLISPSEMPKIYSSDKDIFSRLFGWKIK